MQSLPKVLKSISANSFDMLRAIGKTRNPEGEENDRKHTVHTSIDLRKPVKNEEA